MGSEYSTSCVCGFGERLRRNRNKYSPSIPENDRADRSVLSGIAACSMLTTAVQACKFRRWACSQYGFLAFARWHQWLRFKRWWVWGDSFRIQESWAIAKTTARRARYMGAL